MHSVAPARENCPDEQETGDESLAGHFEPAGHRVQNPSFKRE